MGAGQPDLGHAESLHLFVSAFLDGLAASGVRHVCICPGSRSTPLALLFRGRPSFKVWMHLDERSAAFFALGIAKALREPVALVCTSGTAAVNFAPAVVEAFYSHVPLIVLTSDRPPELHGIGANQTIDQTELYGSHVKTHLETLVPEASEASLHQAWAIATEGAHTARSAPVGPVQINLPFREPLIPLAPAGARPAFHTPKAREVATLDVSEDELAALAALVSATQKGVIVSGPQDDPRFPKSVAEISLATGFPLLADPLSQLRCGPHFNPLVIDSYDAFLRHDPTAQALAPDLVLRFGTAPVSKPLLTYLKRHNSARQVLVGESWSDPALTGNAFFQANPDTVCKALLEMLAASRKPGDKDCGWAERWQKAAEASRCALRGAVPKGVLTEPASILDLASVLPPNATLFAGNSMPVRDLDTLFPAGPQPVRLLANRGASGIDGVTSTALGVSAVSEGAVALVTGDLSFYHDMNGLLAAKRYGLNLTIVLVNNDGGGIFSMLPQANHPEYFEELFGTPHGLDFRPVAEIYGLGYERPFDRREFVHAVKKSIDSGGTNIIEVRTDRATNAQLHREMWEAVSRALEAGADRSEPEISSPGRAP